MAKLTAARAAWLRQFVAYAIVGVAGTALDFGIFTACVALHAWTPVAVTAGYAVATVAQFFLNRRYSFQVFDRFVLHQFGKYVAVTIGQWLLTVALVEIGIRLGLGPLAAKALSIPPTALAGFLANRYYTFGGNSAA